MQIDRVCGRKRMGSAWAAGWCLWMPEDRVSGDEARLMRCRQAMHTGARARASRQLAIKYQQQTRHAEHEWEAVSRVMHRWQSERRQGKAWKRERRAAGKRLYIPARIIPGLAILRAG